MMTRPQRGMAAATILFLAGLVIARASSLPETDIFWSIRYGHDLLHGGAFAPVERWDFSALGKIWVPNSWAWNVVLYLCWAAAGPLGLSLLAAISFGGACALSYLLLRRMRLALEVRLLAVVGFALSQVLFFTVRATATDTLLLLAFATLLTYSRFQRIGWLLSATFVISAVGANFHLSAPIYVVLFPSFYLLLGGEAALRQKLWRATAIALVSAAAAFCTPFGFKGLAKISTVTSASRGVIVEWGPPQLTTLLGLYILLLVILAAIWGARLLRQRAWGPAFLVFAFTLATLSAVRFALYLSVVALVVAAAQVKPGWKPKVRLTASNAKLVQALGALTSVVGVALMSFTLATQGPSGIVFATASDFKAFPAHSRVLAAPSYGSTLILYRPDVQVAADSRNDLLGAAKYTEVANVYSYASASKLNQWLDQHAVDGVWVDEGNAGSAGDATQVNPRMQSLGWTPHPGRYGTAWIRPGR